MIWDSTVWKEELAKDLQSVKSRTVDAGPEASYEQAAVAIEKFAFTSAFIIRKLLEAKKLSDEIESTCLPVRRYQKVDAEVPIHIFNWHRFETFYDLGRFEEINLSPRRLCNMLIHSFVFVLEMDEADNGFETILLNSDHTKNKHLYEINLDTLFAFVDAVATDSIDCLICENLLNPEETIIHKSQNEAVNSAS